MGLVNMVCPVNSATLFTQDRQSNVGADIPILILGATQGLPTTDAEMLVCGWKGPVEMESQQLMMSGKKGEQLVEQVL